MMKKYMVSIITVLFLGFYGITAMAGGQLSAAIISQIQSQFQGRVVGVVPYRGQDFQVQILKENGQVLIVTVDSKTGQIKQVDR